MIHPALTQVDHRPWPVPAGAWRWRQSWHDLLFAHWPIEARRLRPLIPAGLEIQEFDGTSWIGVVPFRMTGVMLRPFPDVPWVSAFPELNVRAYVTRDAKAGVWFLSLDAANRLAVWAARRFFHLPYYNAHMSVRERGEAFDYRSSRTGAEFQAEYRPTSTPYRAAPGTLEHWLTERYCLYAQSADGALWRNEIHHGPWPLQTAEVTIHHSTMIESHGLSVEGAPALVHFARRLDVVVWSGERIA